MGRLPLTFSLFNIFASVLGSAGTTDYGDVPPGNKLVVPSLPWNVMVHSVDLNCQMKWNYDPETLSKTSFTVQYRYRTQSHWYKLVECTNVTGISCDFTNHCDPFLFYGIRMRAQHGNTFSLWTPVLLFRGLTDSIITHPEVNVSARGRTIKVQIERMKARGRSKLLNAFYTNIHHQVRYVHRDTATWFDINSTENPVILPNLHKAATYCVQARYYIPDFSVFGEFSKSKCVYLEDDKLHVLAGVVIFIMCILASLACYFAHKKVAKLFKFLLTRDSTIPFVLQHFPAEMRLAETPCVELLGDAIEEIGVDVNNTSPLPHPHDVQDNADADGKQLLLRPRSGSSVVEMRVCCSVGYLRTRILTDIPEELSTEGLQGTDVIVC
uniref:interferon alpha/beta receptor 2-like n=1 Tax=Myxine glutinosa TaxID=7769 RepID=UPI00358F0BF7